jgi:hypothetical protein
VPKYGFAAAAVALVVLAALRSRWYVWAMLAAGLAIASSYFAFARYTEPRATELSHRDKLATRIHELERDGVDVHCIGFNGPGPGTRWEFINTIFHLPESKFVEIPIDSTERPCGAVLITDRADISDVYPGAKFVEKFGLRLWLVPGS